jgi:quinoprotein glucose dehydrogenase
MSFKGKDGRQYIVIMAGGHGSLGTKMGDSVVAYALPAP